jgi:hypothetical protein
VCVCVCVCQRERDQDAVVRVMSVHCCDDLGDTSKGGYPHLYCTE